MLALILIGLFVIFLIYTNPVLIVIFVVLSIIGFIASQSDEQKEQEKRAQEEAEQDRIRKENELLDFYLLCKRKGLKNPINYSEERSSLLIIGKNSGFGDNLQTCLNAYQKGAEIYLQREWERNEQKKACDAQKELDEAAEQKRLADLVGKEKYLSSIEQQLKEYDAAVKTGEFLLNAACVDLTAQPRKEDWSVAGGFADAIAGPAAALATVSEIQDRNARAELNAAMRRQRAPENMRTASSVKAEAETKYNKLKVLRDAIVDKLVDDGNSEEKYRMLVPIILDQSITASGNIEVNLAVRLEGTPMLFNKPAILDGSLKIDAIQNGVKVGTGYYSPAGFGITDLSQVGFGNNPSQTVLIPVDQKVRFDSSLPYYLDIEPYHLWFIES